jgi:hypothetical protein
VEGVEPGCRGSGADGDEAEGCAEEPTPFVEHALRYATSANVVQRAAGTTADLGGSSAAPVSLTPFGASRFRRLMAASQQLIEVAQAHIVAATRQPGEC